MGTPTPKFGGLKDWLSDYLSAVREGRLHPFTPVERIARAATRDQAWGPTGVQLNRLAELSHDEANAHIIFAVLENRLMSHGERWRSVYKALQVLEFLAKRGAERCPAMGARLLPLLRCLANFAYVGPNDGKDYGSNVRVRSAAVLAVLEDAEELARTRATLADRAARHFEEWVARPLKPTGRGRGDGGVSAGEEAEASDGTAPSPARRAAPATAAPPSPAAPAPPAAPGVPRNSKASVTKQQAVEYAHRLAALQQTSPGSNVCADCQVMSADAAAAAGGGRGAKGEDTGSRPSWAAANLGVFLCMRCASIHRGLGVHVSQVRSLVLDTWLPGQVALMEAAGGNAAANAVLEAQLPPGVRPPRDSPELERFIRRKYADRAYADPSQPWPPPAAVAAAFAAASGGALPPAPPPAGAAAAGPGAAASRSAPNLVDLSSSDDEDDSGAEGPGVRRTVSAVGGAGSSGRATRAVSSVTFAEPGASAGPSGTATPRSEATATGSAAGGPAAQAAASRNGKVNTVANGQSSAAVASPAAAAPAAASPKAQAPPAAPTASGAPAAAAAAAPAVADLLHLWDEEDPDVDADSQHEGETGAELGAGSSAHARLLAAAAAGAMGGGAVALPPLDPRLGVLEWLDMQHAAGVGVPMPTSIPQGPLSPADSWGAAGAAALAALMRGEPAGRLHHNAILTTTSFYPAGSITATTAAPATAAGAGWRAPGGGSGGSPGGGASFALVVSDLAQPWAVSRTAGPASPTPTPAAGMSRRSTGAAPLAALALAPGPGGSAGTATVVALPVLPVQPQAVGLDLGDALEEVAAAAAAASVRQREEQEAQEEQQQQAEEAAAQGGGSEEEAEAEEAVTASQASAAAAATGAEAADLAGGDLLDSLPPRVPAPDAAVPFRGDDPFRASVLPFVPSPVRGAAPRGTPLRSTPPAHTSYSPSPLPAQRALPSSSPLALAAPAFATPPPARPLPPPMRRGAGTPSAAPSPHSAQLGTFATASPAPAALSPSASSQHLHGGSGYGHGHHISYPALPSPPARPLEELVALQADSLDLALRPHTASPHHASHHRQPSDDDWAASDSPAALARARLVAAGLAGAPAGSSSPSLVAAMAKGRWHPTAAEGGAL